MHALLMAAVLTGSGPGERSVPLTAAASLLSVEMRTGTLLFSKGDCLAVKVFTASPYTHVAAVVKHGTETWVYDSVNGAGVRKLMLAEYLSAMSPDVIYVYHPSVDLSEKEQETFRTSLESRIGTPYAIKHHLTGKRCDGLHCAEYVTDALMSVDVIHAERPSKVSPASLLEGVRTHGIYGEGEKVALEKPQPPVEKGDDWCEQMWIDTKVCWKGCCRKMSAWFLCR